MDIDSDPGSPGIIDLSDRNHIYKCATIGPPVKRHLYGVSLVGQ